MDVYQNNEIPVRDIETCLKVIRTMRNFCLGPKVFDAEKAVLLSHAHAAIVEIKDCAEDVKV